MFSQGCVCVCVVSWETLRIPGVLQRLAFTYLIVAVLDVSMTRAQLGGSLTVSHADEAAKTVPHIFIFL